ncbi:MAG: MATE family efflux transporter, partial [Lachnospiraceae bacterium]
MRRISSCCQCDMTDGSISMQLITFMMPILMTQILQQLYSVCDTALVGRCSGADALAAIGTASLIVSVIVNFIIGLSTGISVMISHLYGSKSYQELTCCIQTILVSMVGIGLVMTLAGFPLMPLFLRMLHTPEEIIPAASTYLGISLLGVTAQLIYNAVNAALRALGNTKAALYILVISAVTNLLLDILFMAVLSYGIAGAAAATVIS